MDIKSVVIGVLLATCIFLIFVFVSDKGRYQISVTSSDGAPWILDTTSGIAKKIYQSYRGKSQMVVVDFKQEALKVHK